MKECFADVSTGTVSQNSVFWLAVVSLYWPPSAREGSILDDGWPLTRLLFIIFICLWYVCLCEANICVQVHIETSTQPTTWCVILQAIITLSCWNRDSWLAWNAHSAKWASPMNNLVSASPMQWFQKYTIMLFYVWPGYWTLVLMFAQQALAWPSHLPGPSMHCFSLHVHCHPLYYYSVIYFSILLMMNIFVFSLVLL